MCQPITGLEINAIQNAMQLTLPIEEPAKAQKMKWEDGRDFSGSLA